MQKKLTKSDQRVISGVCGGIAEYFGLDYTLVRVLWVIGSIFLTAILGGIIAYIICAVIIPNK